MKAAEIVQKTLPFLEWFRGGYPREALKADLIAGLTVALVLIPQSMAYAQLAGLPSYFGLYAAFLPPIVSAVFGSSRQLASGPVAVVSLMTAASLAPLATVGSEGYIAYAVLLSFIVGLFQFALGALRLGLVVNFLSHPVVNGFTNAAAIIIATSQLEKMFGVLVDGAEHHYETILRVVKAALHYTHWPTLIMGVAAFAMMFALKKLAPRFPNVLIAVLITTVVSWAIGYEKNATVALADIASAGPKELITGFNAATRRIEELAREKVRATGRIDEARKTNDRATILQAQHAEVLISLKIEELQSKASALRARIRSLLLVRVASSGGNQRYFAKEDVPADVKPEGGIWRIRIGTAPIDEEKIAMTGGGAVVGKIPAGLPSFTLPHVDLKGFLHLLPYAAIISLLGFMEAISIAKAMASKTGQRLDPNQELIGQGLGNMIGAIGKSYPTSGSFSRSAVNLQAGAFSGLSSVFTGLIVVIVLLFFTPLLYYLPQSVLAAIIMMAVMGLINVPGFIHALKVQWYDGVISLITFVSTLIFAPHLDKGIMVGVALSLGVFLYKSMRPRLTSLALNENDALSCVETHGLQECDYLAVIRFEAPLFFANSSFLEDNIREITMTKKKLRHVILVANGINEIDASGEETLSLLVDRLRSAGIDISLCGVNEAVVEVLRRTHLLAKIGEDHLYTTGEQALSIIHHAVHRGVDDHVCPLVAVCRLPQQAQKGA